MQVKLIQKCPKRKCCYLLQGFAVYLRGSAVNIAWSIIKVVRKATVKILVSIK